MSEFDFGLARTFGSVSGGHLLALVQLDSLRLLQNVGRGGGDKAWV
jgi:hypothetical protein